MSLQKKTAIGGESIIKTYNMMGGALEGFAVPVGLLNMTHSGNSYIGGSGDFNKICVPDVTNVGAIPKGLFEKLLELAEFNANDVQLKRNKSRKGNRVRGNKMTKKNTHK
jgi:hypothetical protein